MFIRLRAHRREHDTENAGEQGSFYEWLALGVLAALILVGLAPIAGRTVGDGIARVICTIVHGGDASRCGVSNSGGNKPGKIDINPQWCLSSMHTDDGDVGWKGTFKKVIDISVGQGYKIIRYDSREEDFDGKVKHFVYLAFVDKGDASVDVHKAAKGATIDTGGGVEVQYGAMYRLTPGQADRYLQDIEDYQQARLQEEYGGTPGAVAVNGAGRDWPPKIASDPAITYDEMSGTGDLGGDAELPVGKLPSPKRYVMPNGGGTVQVSGTKTLTTEHWRIYKDAKGNVLPATAVYHTTSGEYTVGVDGRGEVARKSGRGADGKDKVTRTWDFSNTTRITTDDKTGELKNIRYVVTYGDEGSLGTEFGLTGRKPAPDGKGPKIGATTSHGDGKLHTEVVQVNFSTPAERAIGARWLKTHGLEMPPSVANQIFSKTGYLPGVPGDKQVAEAPGADADPFDKLVYGKAMAWKTDAATTSQAYRFSLMLPYRGAEIGPYTDVGSEDTKTQRAQILDAPGADGNRHWINYPSCTAAGNH